MEAEDFVDLIEGHSIETKIDGTNGLVHWRIFVWVEWVVVAQHDAD